MSLYLDCFAGISGDMFLGALLDTGLVSVETLRSALTSVIPAGETWSIAYEKVQRQHYAVGRCVVQATDSAHQRHLSDIRPLIEEASITEGAKARALKTFQILAEAEGAVHGVSPEAVHFHEVGALDAIIDIVGVAVALDALQPREILSAPLPLGSGWMDCAHGRLPIPGPAVAEITRAHKLIVTHNPALNYECTTPTGAALLAACVDRFVTPGTAGFTAPTIAVGYGAGTWEPPSGVLNALRIFALEASPSPEGPQPVGDETIQVLETNLDDVSPQVLAYVLETLMAAGALDVTIAPVTMKKSRPGFQLSVLAPTAQAEALAAIIFRETPTFGIRFYPVQRWVRHRQFREQALNLGCTGGGTVRMKDRLSPDGNIEISQPEFEDCRRVAQSEKIPLSEVFHRLHTPR